MTDIFKHLPHTPYLPFDPAASHYQMLFGNAMPTEYSGWKDEVLSWKKTAYLHGGLNPTDTYRITGPDALRLLSEHCVNSFASFAAGQAKHAVMCNDEGLIMAHGVVVRQGEDDFMTYWLMPWINHLAERGEYDVKGEVLTGEFFLFQLAGPRSLEILEAAAREDLHDIRFLRQRKSHIAGADVNVLRLGMSGSLAYELHGPIEQAHAVHDAVMKAGEPFGIRRLGRAQYAMNHTENGFPQGYQHFYYPWFENETLAACVIGGGGPSAADRAFTGQRSRRAVGQSWHPTEGDPGHRRAFPLLRRGPEREGRRQRDPEARERAQMIDRRRASDRARDCREDVFAVFPTSGDPSGRVAGWK